MSLLRAKAIEVGVRGQAIIVRGSTPPTDDNRYDREQEFELDLSLARELHRLLGKLIPLAEKSRPAVTIVAVNADSGTAA